MSALNLTIVKQKISRILTKYKQKSDSVFYGSFTKVKSESA